MKKLTRRSDTMDAICEVVGFSATISLIRWFGGGNVVVPSVKNTNCMLRAIIGRQSLNRMVDAFGGSMLWIPIDPMAKYKASDARARDIAKLARAGLSRKEIAESLGVKPYLVSRVRRALGMPAEGVRQNPKLAKNLERERFCPGVSGVGEPVAGGQD